MAEEKKPVEGTPVETTTETPVEEKAADPFARLKKKKVAVAKPLWAWWWVSWKVKRWGKISPKVFMIWCWFFFILFLWLVYAGLYFAITSSDFLQGIGLEVEDVKMILLIFAAMFFGLIFFAWFYVFVLNVYRLVTVKTKSKIKFILWLIWWIIMILATIITWTLSIQKIRSLWWAQKIQTNLLLVPFLETRDGIINAWTWNVPLIAPMKLRYQLNKPQFDKNVAPAIWSNPITWFSVDCGNGQFLSANSQIHLWANNWYFDDYCLYLNKWWYDLTLNVDYTNRVTWEKQTQSFYVTKFTVNGEIRLVPEEDEPYLNDKLNEVIMWVAPVLVDVKAQLLFSDLGLKNDRIIWDMDWDKQADIENNSNFIYPFGQSKLHTISYRLPELQWFEDTWFAFDVRIVESDLAQCTLKSESIDWDKKYKFTPQFDELVDVGQYQYTIYDKQQDTFVKRNEKESRDTHSHTFESWWDYEIQVSYYTPEGEKWSCVPKPLQVWFIWNRVNFEARFRQDESTPFVSVGDSTAVQIDEVNEEITVTMLPAIIELDVQSIQPDPNADLKLYYDWRQVFGDKNQKIFEVNIGKLWTKEMKFVMTSITWKQEEQIYSVDVSRQPVKAFMNVEPDVGEDPLEVVLDASISPLYDEEDEIVYFTWDFGDGTTRQNISQWKVTHEYRYDTEKDSGEFYPKVTVKTKKWYTDSYRLETPIVVKKKQREVEISVDSHPTRQARVWEIVTFSVETDWLVDHIDWDFWPKWWVGCDGRSCSTTPVRFDKPWDYEIRVEIQYADDVPVTSRTNIKVF